MLQVTQSTDPAFPNLLSTHFPEIASYPSKGALLASAVIVHNTSRIPIRLYTISWGDKVGSKDTRRYATAVTEVSSTSLLYGEKPVLLPNEMQLISPVFRWSAKGWPADSTPRPPQDLSPFVKEAPLWRNLEFPAVDAIVTAMDDRLGPDSSTSIERYDVLREAEEEDNGALQDALESPGQITPEEVLESIRTRQVFAPSPKGEVFSRELVLHSRRLSLLLARDERADLLLKLHQAGKDKL